MGNKKEIVLSSEELTDLKDTIKFREKVLLELKSLNGVSHKVTQLETKMSIYGGLTICLILGVVTMCFRMFAK